MDATTPDGGAPPPPSAAVTFGTLVGFRACTPSVAPRRARRQLSAPHPTLARARRPPPSRRPARRRPRRLDAKRPPLGLRYQRVGGRPSRSAGPQRRRRSRPADFAGEGGVLCARIERGGGARRRAGTEALAAGALQPSTVDCVHLAAASRVAARGTVGGIPILTQPTHTRSRCRPPPRAPATRRRRRRSLAISRRDAPEAAPARRIAAVTTRPTTRTGGVRVSLTTMATTTLGSASSETVAVPAPTPTAVAPAAATTALSLDTKRTPSSAVASYLSASARSRVDW